MLCVILLICIVFHYAYSDCILPMSEGSWNSTTRGTWLVSTTVSKSFINNFESTILPLSTTVSLECVNSTDTQYILVTPVQLFGMDFKFYICIDIHPVQNSSDLFVYYILTSQDQQNIGDRFVLNEKDACNNTVFKTAVNMHLLMKTETPVSAVSCPNLIHGQYNVEYEASVSGGVATRIGMSICEDGKQMVFTNVQPNSNLAFSNGHILHCIYSTTQDSVVYVHTYNNDTSVDNVDTVRVACWELEAEGDHVRATVFRNHCINSKNATSVPTGGQSFVFRPNGTCDATGPTSPLTVSAEITTNTFTVSLLPTATETNVPETTKGQPSCGSHYKAIWIYVATTLMLRMSSKILE